MSFLKKLFGREEPQGCLCTWCRQPAGGSFKEWERDLFLDVLTCSVCGGTSLWRWEMVLIYIGPLEPPEPAFRPADFYDIPSARLKLI